jgi:hypothetical protein
MVKKSRITSNASGISQQIPQVKGRPATKCWAFSLAYWRQIEFFGLECEKVNEKWFVSLLERFRDLSQLAIEEVVNDHSDLWRFHSINWGQKGIPFQRKNLDWIP